MPFALLMLMGVSAYLTVHAFWIWMLSRSDPKNLWIALWCLNSLYYQANRYRQLTAGSDDSLMTADRACFLSAVFVIAIILLLNHALARIRPPRWLIGVLVGVTALVVVVHGGTDLFISSNVGTYHDWFGKTVRFTAVGPLYLPFLIAASGVAFTYGVVVLFRSEPLDRTERLIFLFCYALYLVFGLNDILLFSGHIQTTSMFEYGFAAVAVGLTFARAKEIQGFQGRLEKLVHQRTRQLHASEVLYRELVEQSGDVVFTADINGYFTFVNPVVETITGYSREEFVGKHFADVIAPEAREEIIEFFKEQVRRGVDMIEAEIPIITKGGGKLWVDQITRATCKDGRIVGFECSARDITDRKRLERRLQESEERLRTIVTSVGEGIGEVDSDERFLFANPAAEEIFGVSPGLLVGRSVEEFVTAETMENIRNQSARRSLGHHDCYEIEVLREDGSRLDVMVTASPNPHGPGAFGVFRDITQLKVQQQALRRATAEAEAAVLAKNQFLANMSHEIRTPLHGIKGMLELAALTDLTPEQRQYLETAFSSAENLSNLLGDILDFSKIDAGRLQLDHNVFDIRECVSEAMQSVTGSALEKDIDFSWDVHADVPDLVIGDELRLRQILVNLLANAVKFTRTGSVGVEVGLDAGVEDGVGLVFKVHDTGIGIPEDRWEAIFDPFIQVDGSFSRAAEGTGLGLAICRQLVTIMGGEMTVDSGVGRGSTFTFTLTFGLGAESGDRLRSVSASGIGRVLVVDDNEVNRKTAQLYLEKLRCSCDVAEGGAQALEMIRKRRYDVILMDVQMPVMDGLEATKRIRADVPEDEQPWIIALTAAATSDDRRRCLEAGMDDYLSKPVGIEDLSKKLRLRPPGSEGRDSGRRELNAARVAGRDRMDLARFDEIAGFVSDGNPEFLRHVVEAFKTNAAGRLERMYEAVAGDDAHTLALCAHNIKGSAMQLGATQVGQLCVDLETLAKKGDLTIASNLVELIEEECLQAGAILDLLVGSEGTGAEDRGSAATGRRTALVVGNNPDVNSVTARLLEDLGYRVREAADGAEAIQCVSRERDRITLAVTDVQLPKISGGEFAELARRVIPDLRIVFCSGQQSDFGALQLDRDGTAAFLEKPYTVAELEDVVRRLVPD